MQQCQRPVSRSMHGESENLHKSPNPGLAGRYSARAGTVFPPHEHREWEFVFYTRGSARVQQASDAIHATAGILVMTPPGVTHTEIAETDYSNVHLQVFAPADERWPVWVRDDAAGGMARVFELLADEAPSEHAMRALLFDQLEILIERASAAGATTSPQRALVLRAERRLRSRIADPFTLASLAGELGVASSTLRQAFARERGVSPRDRFIEIRMQHALARLRTSTLTLEHIAMITGFSSASHLSRAIKQATGRTPRELRRD